MDCKHLDRRLIKMELSTSKYVTGFGKIGLNAANNFFQYPRVKPFF